MHPADNKSLLDKLIYQESNFKILILKNKLSDNLLFDNIVAWIQKNKTVGKLFTHKDNNFINNISKIKEYKSTSVEKIRKNNDLVKRDL